MVDATKTARLRAKAQSTAYPAEAESFRRKALELMARHGISEKALERALDGIFAGRRQPRGRSAPWASRATS